MSQIRAFIAVHIPETPELAALMRRFQRMQGLPRPAATDGLHVTLKFLGDIDRSQVDEIAAATREIAVSQAVNEIQLRGLGAFPNPSRPSVIWVGLHPPTILGTIAADLETRLESLGIPRDPRPFHPHLTLLRIKSRPPDALLELLQESTELNLGSVRVETITLYRSELIPGGPRYTKLASCPLATALSKP